MERLALKFETARALAPRPVAKAAAAPTPVGVVYFGSTSAAMDEAIALLAETGMFADALRVCAFPLAPEIGDFVRAHAQVFVVEQNRDAQMRTLMATDLSLDPARLTSILHYGGAPITARFIADAIAERVKPAVAPLMLEDVT